jgi:hypothetical protein
MLCIGEGLVLEGDVVSVWIYEVGLGERKGHNDFLLAAMSGSRPVLVNL